MPILHVSKFVTYGRTIYAQYEGTPPPQAKLDIDTYSYTWLSAWLLVSGLFRINMERWEPLDFYHAAAFMMVITASGPLV